MIQNFYTVPACFLAEPKTLPVLLPADGVNFCSARSTYSNTLHYALRNCLASMQIDKVLESAIVKATR